MSQPTTRRHSLGHHWLAAACIAPFAGALAVAATPHGPVAPETIAVALAIATATIAGLAAVTRRPRPAEG